MAVQAPDVAIGRVGDLAFEKIRSGPRWVSQLDIWIPGGVLLFIALACFAWPLVYPVPNPSVGDLGAANLLPLSSGHILGTDPLGFDIMSRILYGGRVSLEVGLGATGLGMFAGGFLGMFAGFKGGAIDAIIMRILDMFLAFPSLVLATVVTTYLGPSELHVIWAISFFSVPAFARLARAQTLSVREFTFVTASRLVGRTDRKVMLRHVAPNIFPQLMTFALLGVGIAIVVEASLSFLGLGVPPPGPSWGNMIANGQSDLASNSYLVIIPGCFLFATVLCLNSLGDAFRSRWSEL